MTIATALRIATLAGTLALVTGCAASPRLFVNREADMTFYRKVAVLPLANLSGDPYAAGRVTRALVTELVIAERFRLVDPAEFLAELDRLGARPDVQGQVDPQRVREAAGRFEASGLIRGAVTEYQMRRSGSDEYPIVSFDVEMVDVATGNIVWRVSVTEKGRGRMLFLGAQGSRTFGRVTQEACARAVELLQRRAF